MKINQIYVGSWFQRTKLHLSEIYDFLNTGKSPLNFDKKKLKKLKENLDIIEIKNIQDDFEYIFVTTKKDLSFKIYEDGLIVLGVKHKNNIKKEISEITSYYENELSSALKYIFSLGAPLPKELANIKNVYPYFIVLDRANEEYIENLLIDFNEEKKFEIKEKTFDIYRGDMLYIINSKGESLENIEKFVGEQIFIREFKSQMHRYLNLHRVIWESIASVKERGSIKGSDIKEFKNKIEGYEKSISMIDTRINQMGVYINTRGKIIKNDKEMDKFIDILEFKYETLDNTLKYVKEIWGMTKRYVSSALNVFSDLQSKATNNSIKNLTVVTSMGVGATLIGLFTKTTLPQFSYVGILYFATLALIGWGVNKIMNILALRKNYSIKNVKADVDIR